MESSVSTTVVQTGSNAKTGLGDERLPRQAIITDVTGQVSPATTTVLRRTESPGSVDDPGVGLSGWCDPLAAYGDTIG